MYKIIRRISSSLFTRPDRPWSEDATSNAPQVGQKRRLSSSERDDAEEVGTLSKKSRKGPAELLDDASQGDDLPSRPGQDTEEVKEVTQGVGEVELEDKKASGSAVATEAAAVPLPSSPVLQATTQEAAAAAIPLPDSPILQAIPDSKDVNQVPELSEEQILDRDAEGEDEEALTVSVKAVTEEGQSKEQEGSKETEQIPAPSAQEEASSIVIPSTATDSTVEEKKETGSTPSATQ